MPFGSKGPSRAATRPSSAITGAGRLAIALASGLLILGIGALDYLTGWELSFAIFYFLPVSITAWYLSRSLGLLAALTCAIAWFAADVVSHPPYAHPAIAVWNALVRLAIFAAAAWLLSRLRKNLEHETAQARTDRLTGASNAFAFYEAAGLELNRSSRYSHPLTLAYLDIDDFKDVNDRLGHPAGDALLVKLADAMRSRIRTTDLLARLGGDEFAILFPETDHGEARAVIHNLQATLAEVTREDGQAVTVSIGVLTCASPSGSLEDLIARADGLMYRAKAGSKNCARFEVADDRPAETVAHVSPGPPSGSDPRRRTRSA